MKLTKDQQKLVEKNHNLIYHTIRKCNVKQEDFYDVCAIGLCKAACKYDSNKANFSTFAIRCMVNEIKLQQRKEMALIRSCDRCPERLDAVITNSNGDEFTLADFLTTGLSAYDELVTFKLSDILTEKELYIAELKYKGYDQSEIGDLLGISQSMVSRHLLKAKNKLRKEGVII